jgi:NitT/TauT family transport system ATP-binding protein
MLDRQVRQAGERTTGDCLVSAESVTKRFCGRTPVSALESVSLRIGKGEFVAVVGPSGCGKTTLLRIIAGLEQPSSGSVTLSRPDLRIGFVFQDPNLLPWRTALENVALPLELEAVAKPVREDRAREALALCGLSGFDLFLPRDLSGGMKQRVAIARALVRNPDLLVMDEPFAALDILTRQSMCDELRRIWRATGATAVYVTHDIREAVYLSDRVVVMSPSPGRVREIVAVDLPAERDERTMDLPRFVELHALVRDVIREQKGNAVQSRHEPAEEKKPSHLAFLSHLLAEMPQVAQYAAVLILLLGLWEGIVRLFAIPHYIFPSFSRTMSEYARLLGGSIWHHTWFTLSETLAGFFIGSVSGACLGYVLAKWERAGRVLMPFVVAAQMAPKVALAPMIVIWFGFGITSKAFLIALIVFFPILANTILGYQQVSRDGRELMRSAKARPAQVFAKLELPTMLPALFAGLRVSITLAVIGAVVGEFVGAKGGLGYLIVVSSGNSNIPQMFAAMLQLVVLGLALYGLVVALERKLVKWV